MKTFRYIHEWTHLNMNLVFHTLPMIHIGSPSFYENVSKLIEAMNFLLIEGVSYRKNAELGTYVRFAERVGLVSQFENLKVPSDLPVINIDMKTSEFRNQLGKLPLRERLQMWFIDRFLKVYRPKKIEQFLKDLDNRFCYDESGAIELIDPKNHYASSHSRKSKLDLLLENRRNQEIEKNIKAYIEQNRDRDYRLDVAIVFGDGHMPYIYKTLLARGFEWKLEKKVYVF